MRYAVIVLAVLGALGSAIGAVLVLTASTAASAKDSPQMGLIACLLLGGALLGLAGAVLAFCRYGRTAGLLLVGSGLAPIFLAPAMVAFTFFLLIAGCLSFTIRAKDGPGSIGT